MKNDTIFVLLALAASVLILTRPRTRDRGSPVPPGTDRAVVHSDQHRPAPSPVSEIGHGTGGDVSAPPGSIEGAGPPPVTPGSDEHRPEDRIARWKQYLREIALPEYEQIRGILDQAGIDPGTVEYVAPRIYDRLAVVTMYDEFRELARRAIEDSHRTHPDPEDRQAFDEHQRYVMSVWERIASNTIGELKFRIVDEAGLQGSSGVDALVQIRPQVPLTDPNQWHLRP